jgi:hypothetical protein
MSHFTLLGDRFTSREGIVLAPGAVFRPHLERSP